MFMFQMNLIFTPAQQFILTQDAPKASSAGSTIFDIMSLLIINNKQIITRKIKTFGGLFV